MVVKIDLMLSHSSSQVQVYWSENPKAKFVKQGEVDQVNIFLTMITFTDIITFRFPSLQS